MRNNIFSNLGSQKGKAMLFLPKSGMSSLYFYTGLYTHNGYKRLVKQKIVVIDLIYRFLD